jgi:hypothetical protein
MGKLKPEAAYFVAEHGHRCAMMFFDMKDASDIPGIVEPLFAGLKARVELLPVELLSGDECRRSKKGIGHRKAVDVRECGKAVIRLVLTSRCLRFR